MSKVFYMPAPDLTGVWAASEALPEYKEEVSIFKFTVADDCKSASFAVCDDTAACRQALTGLRRGWMAQVCEAAMFAPASTKTIKTPTEGTADLLAEDGIKIVWKVKNKAAIEFLDENGTASTVAAVVATAAPVISGSSKVCYMPAPDLTGSWDPSGALDTFKEETSVFKFAINPNGETAVFSVCDDVTACRQALTGFRRGWMAQVCNSADFAPASTKSIKTVKFGTAEIQPDGKWKIKDKAEITFVE